MNAATETTRRKPSGKMEQRAAAECARIERNGEGAFCVVWKKSRTWGNCPSISDLNGEKAAHASGCGYDKLSAVVCEFLAWLSPSGYLKTGGAGIRATIQELAGLGWELEHTYDGNSEDGFTIRRAGPVFRDARDMNWPEGSGIVFLGHYTTPKRDGGTVHVGADLYFCANGGGSDPFVSAQYSNDGADYSSGLEFASANRHLRRAATLAIEAGLLDRELVDKRTGGDFSPLA